MAALGAVVRALRALSARGESARNERLLAELFAASGRLLEALAHARHAADPARADPTCDRETRRLARALAFPLTALSTILCCFRIHPCR